MVEIVSVVIHVPDVWNILFLAKLVHPQTVGYQTVPVARGDPQYLQHLLSLFWIREQQID